MGLEIPFFGYFLFEDKIKNYGTVHQRAAGIKSF
jgi:hypothetical protein